MQATTCFHDGVPHPILQEADGIFHDPVALHPTHGMFYPPTHGRDATIHHWFKGRAFSTTRFLLGLENGDPREHEALEALSLIQTTASWPGIPGELRQALRRRVAFIRGASAGHVTGLLDHEEGLTRVTLLLATGIFFLLLRIFRTLEGSCGAIVHNRGEVAGSSVAGRASLVAHSSAVRVGRRSWSAHA